MAHNLGFRSVDAGKRHVVTGPSGIADKKGFVQSAAEKLRGLTKEEVRVYHIGRMMYEHDPTIPAGRILALPIYRLELLRQVVMEKVIEECSNFDGHVILDTRGVFRWQYSMEDGYGLDVEQLKRFGATTFFTVIDNVQNLWLHANRTHARFGISYSLQDMLVWREEEIRFTNWVSKQVAGKNRFFVTATHNRDRSDDRTDLVAKIMADPNRPKLYTSFPMTHVAGNEKVAEEIRSFKAAVAEAEEMVYFDPADVDEFFLCLEAQKALEAEKEKITVPIAGEEIEMDAAELVALWKGINDSIVGRDLILVHQSDLVFALIPQIEGGLPALSSGVEAEINDARWSGRLVHICWQVDRTPSPFTTWGVIVHKTPNEFLEWLRKEQIIS